MFGGRLLLLEHVGRSSGQPRFVCLEVVERPSPESVVIVSGFGSKAQWFRNLSAEPRCYVSIGRRHRSPARARFMSDEESAATLSGYQRQHPGAWRHLKGAIEQAVGGQVDRLPMVELVLDPAAQGRP